jgi:hypothetical protein
LDVSPAPAFPGAGQAVALLASGRSKIQQFAGGVPNTAEWRQSPLKIMVLAGFLRLPGELQNPAPQGRKAPRRSGRSQRAIQAAMAPSNIVP